MGRDLSAFEYDGIQFGSVSRHDLSIVCKTSDITDLSDSELDYWKDFILSAVASYTATKRLIEENGYEAVVYFNQYVYQMSALLAARRCGVKHFTLSQPGHRGIDYRRLIVIADSTSRKIPREQRQSWADHSSVPLDSAIVGEIGTDILTRFGVGGSHVFSPKRKEAPDHLKERPISMATSKVLVAF